MYKCTYIHIKQKEKINVVYEEQVRAIKRQTPDFLNVNINCFEITYFMFTKLKRNPNISIRMTQINLCINLVA